MATQTLKRLSLKQGEKAERKADKRYIEEVLDGKPSHRKIRQNNVNQKPVTIMEWLAMFFLVFGLFPYAWMKVQPFSVLYADTFWGTENVYFQYATGIVFGLLVTIGFIFFKLQTEDLSVLTRQEENPIEYPKIEPKLRVGNLWKIEVWSPRMFGILTYMVLLWQLAVAIEGIHDYRHFIEWLNAILPVLAEIGLATTVAKVFSKIRSRNIELGEALILQKQTFKDAFNNRHKDARYLTIFFQELREMLSNMRGNGWLKLANSEITRQAIMSEYERLTAGLEFALDVFEKRTVRASIVNQIEEQADIMDSLDKKDDTDGYRPPNRATAWTPETLRQHFTARPDLNTNMVYTQKNLDADYNSGYGVRTAFRGNKSKKDGAKWWFTTK